MHCSAVIGRGDREAHRVDDAAEADDGLPGSELLGVDPALHHAAGRDELLAGAHLRAREAGLVALHHRHLGGVVHEAEVGGVDAVLGHLLPRRVDGVRGADDRGPLGVAVELGQLLELPHRRHLGIGVVPGHATGRCAPPPGRCAACPSCWCAPSRGCRCSRPRRRTASRGTGRRSRSPPPCRRGRGGRRGAGRTDPARGARRSRRARPPGAGRSRRAPSARRWGSPPGSRRRTSRTAPGTGSERAVVRRPARTPARRSRGGTSATRRP